MLSGYVMAHAYDDRWDKMTLGDFIKRRLFFAPLGTFIMNKLSNKHFSHFLYFIFIIQYVGAMFVIRPGLGYSLLSVGIIICGIVFSGSSVRIKR